MVSHLYHFFIFIITTPSLSKGRSGWVLFSFPFQGKDGMGSLLLPFPREGRDGFTTPSLSKGRPGWVLFSFPCQGKVGMGSLHLRQHFTILLTWSSILRCPVYSSFRMILPDGTALICLRMITSVVHSAEFPESSSAII